MVAIISPFLLAVSHAVVAAETTGSPPRALTGLEMPYTLFTFVAGYSFGPSVREIQNQGWIEAVRVHPVQVVIALATLAAVLASVSRLRSRAALALALLLAAPLLATYLGAAVTTKAYNVRYTLPGLVGLLGLMAMAGTSRRVSRLAIGLAVVVFAVADLQWFGSSRYWKDDSRGAVDCLSRLLPAGGEVLVSPGYMAPVLSYYAGRQRLPLAFVRLDDDEDIVLASGGDALVVTRLHHTAAWEELLQRFGATARPDSVLTVPGYRLYVRGAAPRCGGEL
jgi:hypothetical protein